MQVFRYPVACALAVASVVSHGEGEVTELGPMVISATRAPSLLADAPVRTLVMESDTIQRLHSRDIRDALRMLSGIQLREIHGKTGEEVQLQGLNGDRVLILVDGMPVSATTGSTVDTSQLGALDIEQIEVIPGAASALYGSAAMGGVINIITRKTEAATGGRISAQAGTFGSDRELSDELLPQRHLLVSGHTEFVGLKWNLMMDRRISSEFDLDDSTYATQGFDGTKTQVKLDVSNQAEKGRWQWRLNAENYEEALTNRRVTSSGSAGYKTEDLSRQRMTAQADLHTSSGHWIVQALYEQQSDDTAQLNKSGALPGSLWREADYDQYKAVAQYQTDIGSGFGYQWLATSGLEVFGESLSQDKAEVRLTCDVAAEGAVSVNLPSGGCYIYTPEVDGADRGSVEAFMAMTATRQLSNGNVLEWAPGLRLQNDSDFGGYASPTLGARQKFVLGNEWQVQLRESIGLGYRVPNLKDRYYVFDHSVNGYKVLGNPDLVPEKSHSFQMSASLSDQRHWNIELSGFVNRLYDLIEAEDSGERESGGSVVIYRYENLENARTFGAEFSVQYSTPYLSSRLSYAWMTAEDLDTHLPLLLRAPRHLKSMTTVQWTEAWDTTLTLDYQSGMASGISSTEVVSYSPDILRLDLKTGYRLQPDLLLFGGINNLTDNVRDPSDSYDRRPSEGRFPYVGVDFRF